MDLSEAVSREIGLSRSESSQLVGRVLELMVNALVEEKEVKMSSFGTFLAQTTPSRIGRNPKNLTEIIITSRYRVKFRPSQVMKELVAERDVLKTMKTNIESIYISNEDAEDRINK